LGAYDRICHTHSEAYSKWATTQGAIVMAGNMGVASKYGTNALYYWEIYHLMGDPSVMPYLTQAQVINITVQPVIAVGATSLQVNAVPYAYVALTDSATHTLRASAFANASGVATLTLPSDLATGAYELAASAQQYRTAFRELHVVAPTAGEAYAFASRILTLAAPNAGDTVPLSVMVKNIGEATANSVVVHLWSDTPGLDFAVDSVVVAAVLPGGNVIVGVDAVIGQQVSDGTEAVITATTSWGDDGVTSVNFPVSVKAPVLRTSYSSNILTVLPGDAISVDVTVANYGHAALPSGRLVALSPTALLNVSCQDTAAFSIAAGGSVTVPYSIQTDSQLPSGIVVPLYVQMEGFYNTIDDTLSVISSLLATETFESGSFHLTGWTQGTYPWTFTSSESDGGTWSLRSNASLSHSQTSEVTLGYTFSEDDSIRFSYKVSSENYYDMFYFYIDGQETLVASGDVDWTSVAYPVQQGTHTFRFAYTKDYSVSSNQDCAWIDNIVLPPVTNPVNFQSDTVCAGSLYMVGSDTVDTGTPGAGTLVVSDSEPMAIVDYTVLPVHNIDTVVAACDSLWFGDRIYTESETLSYSEVTPVACDSIVIHLVVNYSVTDTIQTVVEGDSYQWGDSCYTVSGEYCQTFTTEAGCDSVVVMQLTLVSGGEGIDNTDVVTVVLYPNPTVGEVYFSKEVSEVAVYDASGRLVVKQARTKYVDLSQLPAGTYLLRLGLPEGEVSCRVVKK